MTVLTIRAHKRFGVCRKIRLHRAGEIAVDGLLIELSLEGCRISNIDSGQYAPEDRLTITVEGRQPFDACVRWHGERMIGLRLVHPLHHAELAELITHCRGGGEVAEARRA